MWGLTVTGIIHTLISLIAVGSGGFALVRNGKITRTSQAGKIFVITTLITCLTGFGIYQHGGFGKAHVLGIITLLVLAVAMFAGKSSRPFGKISPYVEVVAYSMTFFLHLIPGITETLTRLPLHAPVAMGPEDPLIQKLIGTCFLLFAIGAVLQVVKLKRGATDK